MHWHDHFPCCRAATRARWWSPKSLRAGHSASQESLGVYDARIRSVSSEEAVIEAMERAIRRPDCLLMAAPHPMISSGTGPYYRRTKADKPKERHTLNLACLLQTLRAPLLIPRIPRNSSQSRISTGAYPLRLLLSRYATLLP
jgi:hypothetical protein